MRIFVTGANGFIGRRVCALLYESGMDVVAACREPGASPANTKEATIGAIEDVGDWQPWLADVDVIVHLAAVTHSADLVSPAAWPRYEAVNATATQKLAEAARISGVSRMLFMSSIKVNDERAPVHEQPRKGFRFEDPPQPRDNYGKSKLQAEQFLAQVADVGGLDITVLRPPLVYGPGVKGNLLQLMRWIAKGRPLPLADIDNRRSMVYVGNLADAVLRAVQSTQAGFRGYTLADVDLSTAELAAAIARALKVESRLFRCPLWMLDAIGKLTLGDGRIKRLTGSLTVDSNAAHDIFGWEPRVPFEQAMQETAEWFLSTQR